MKMLYQTLEGKHSGPVFTMDFNQQQSNLLASGSSDCDIIIWDINNPSSPMTPGAKPNMTADVTGLAWNRQVEHIMASNYAGRCVVYDLRKSASIIQISESVSRIKAHSVCWHPNVATQLILCSSDDSSPFGQVWDLRFAAAPLRSLEGHQRGIMVSSWCDADPDIFLTSGKDNKIYAWNPNVEQKGEIIGEFPSYNQWSFDLSWCKKDPSLVATSSVDGTLSVYSLIGGGKAPSQTNKFSAIADSFPGMEMPTEVPQPSYAKPIQLKNPPKWFACKAGASFGFGGRLVSFGGAGSVVTISQVVTEPELVTRSSELEQALTQLNMSDYCVSKINKADLEHLQTLWQFIGATFDTQSRSRYMDLLGFNKESVAAVVRPEDMQEVSPVELAEKMENFGYSGGESSSSLDPSEQFEIIASTHSDNKTPDTEIIEEEESGSGVSAKCFELGISSDSVGLIRHALIMGDFTSAVKLCLNEKKTDIALILAKHAGEELFNKTQNQVLSRHPHPTLSPLLNCIIGGDLVALVEHCSLSQWKEALVAVATYADEDQFLQLIDILGQRLESSRGDDDTFNACLCYVVSGSLDRFVSCWAKSKKALSTPKDLQDLVEIIVVLQRSFTLAGQNNVSQTEDGVSSYLCHYAALLASQGAAKTAISYLSNATEGEMFELKERLCRSLGVADVATPSLNVNANFSARNRNTSTSSQGSIYRKTSTPQSFQPNQFTPSVQAQQAYAASLPQSQPPQGRFFNPVQSNQNSQFEAVPPTMNESIPRFGAHPMMQPEVSSPSAPPAMSSAAVPGGLRRPGAPNRYANVVHGINTANTTMFTPEPLMPQPPSSLHSSNTFNPMQPSNPIASAYNPLQPNSQPSAFNPIPPVGLPAASNNHMDPNAAFTPAAFDANIPRGWNDPPSLSGGRKAKQHQQQQLPSSEPPMPAPMVPEPAFTGFPEPSRSGGVEFPQPVQYAAAPSVENVVKGPLPTEHQVIKDALDRLRERAISTTQNMMAKQRLEDLASKLDILYDKIRDQTVGPNTLNGLHQIVNAVKLSDYHTALRIHAQTISSGNFSEMARFMPAVKMLLTTCMQCQVVWQ